MVGEDIEEVPKEATETTLVETTEDPVETSGDLVGAIGSGGLQQGMEHYGGGCFGQGRGGRGGGGY